MKAFAKHKKLGREFPVQEINFVAKWLKCDGHVDAGICMRCDADKECNIPIFKLDEVELRFEGIGSNE